MSVSSLASLKKYLADCVNLRGNVDDLIEDWEYARLRQGRIYYAIDFSEIYAYVYPNRLAKQVRLFSDDDARQQIATNEYLLRKILFGGPVILLTPHQIELDGLVSTVSTAALADLTAILTQSKDELKRARNEPEFERIVAVSASYLQEGRKPAEEERDFLVAFVAKYAPSLSLIAKKGLFRPATRLKKVLAQTSFIDLASLLGKRWDDFVPDEKTVGRWHKNLGELRADYPDSSNYLDALTMGYLKRANELVPAQKRLKLVTRSGAMHKLYEAEQEEHWSTVWGHVLRHPRSFIALMGSPDGQHDARDESLESRLHSLDRFIASAEDARGQYAAKWARPTGRRRTRRSRTVPRKEELQWVQLLKEVKERWHVEENLAFSDSLKAFDDDSENTPLGEAEDRVVLEDYRVILRLLSGDADVQHAISTRIVEVAEEIRVIHSRMGFVQQVIRSGLALQPFRRKTRKISVLGSSRHSMPHSLQFYAPMIYKSLRAGDDDEKVLKEFLQNPTEASRYEALLATAYLLATLRHWDRAERYCDLAIETPQDMAEIPHHEGYFLRAICRRMNNPSAVRYKRALEDVGEAVKAKRLFLKDQEYDDPRYLNERATHIYRWNKITDEGEDLKPPPMREAVQLWERAREKTTDDKVLLALILNNLCYFYLDHAEEHERKRAMGYYRSLVKGVKAAGIDQNDLPPNVGDTLVFGRWMLFGDTLNAKDKARLVSQLRTILESGKKEIPPEDRKRIGSHIRAIEEGKKVGGAI